MMIFAFFYSAGILKNIFVCDIKTQSLQLFELLIKLCENETFSDCDLDMSK